MCVFSTALTYYKRINIYTHAIVADRPAIWIEQLRQRREVAFQNSRIPVEFPNYRGRGVLLVNHLPGMARKWQSEPPAKQVATWGK